MTFTQEEIDNISTTLETLMLTIHELCDYIARTSDPNEPAPDCFIGGFALLKNYMDQHNAIQSADELITKAKST